MKVELTTAEAQKALETYLREHVLTRAIKATGLEVEREMGGYPKLVLSFDWVDEEVETEADMWLRSLHGIGELIAEHGCDCDRDPPEHDCLPCRIQGWLPEDPLLRKEVGS